MSKEKNYYYITGTSSGIGKAIAEILLEDANNFVFGFSRRNSIKNDNYSHQEIDFSNLEKLYSFEFPKPDNPLTICLINNAGILGDVKQVGRLDNRRIAETFVVNSIAPSIMTNKFIGAFGKYNVQKTILNVSSGAGRHVIESWSAYCASKSALDMFSMVATDEQKSNSRNPVRVFSVAPGIIDTKMQDEIREIDKKDFRDVEAFISYKKKNLLISPEETAKKLLFILRNPNAFESAILDVRDLS